MEFLEPETLKVIAHRLFDFEQTNEGLDCLLLAYQQAIKYFSGSDFANSYLIELCQRDVNRFRSFLLDQCAVWDWAPRSDADISCSQEIQMRICVRFTRLFAVSRTRVKSFFPRTFPFATQKTP